MLWMFKINIQNPYGKELLSESNLHCLWRKHPTSVYGFKLKKKPTKELSTIGYQTPLRGSFASTFHAAIQEKIYQLTQKKIQHLKK